MVQLIEPLRTSLARTQHSCQVQRLMPGAGRMTERHILGPRSASVSRGEQWSPLRGVGLMQRRNRPSPNPI